MKTLNRTTRSTAFLVLALLFPLLLALALAGCAAQGSNPDQSNPTPDTSVGPTSKTPFSERRGLIEPKPKAAEPGPPPEADPENLNLDNATFKQFTVVIDEVRRVCLLVTYQGSTGLHCFDSADVP